MNLFVYTDGSCKGNPGKGGYAFIAYDEYGEEWIRSSGCEMETTNNRMELIAVIESLKTIDKLYQNCKIKIYSDSAYVVNCFLENWIDNWQKNGWKTNKGENVLNRDLWEVLYFFVKKTSATFERTPRKDVRIQIVDKEAKLAVSKLN
jgi:ribonuclease HI